MLASNAKNRRTIRLEIKNAIYNKDPDTSVSRRFQLWLCIVHNEINENLCDVVGPSDEIRREAVRQIEQRLNAVSLLSYFDLLF